VVDTTAPSLNVPADATVECGGDTSPAATGEATATDTCGTATVTSSDVDVGTCGEGRIIVRTWTAVDQCGNGTSLAQTISVVDTTPPDLNCTDQSVISVVTSSSATGCVGKLTEITLKYTGQSCAASVHSQASGKVTCSGDPASAAPVRIRVTAGNNASEVYADVSGVALNGTIVAKALNANRSKFTSETRVQIYGAGNVVLQDIRFHTSCSQPLNVGNKFGGMEVVSMKSLKPGHHYKVPKKNCATTNFVNSCSGKVGELKLTYTGQDCSASSHSQAASKVTCSGNPALASPVRILITGASGPEANQVYLNATNVALNGTVIASAANAGKSAFGAETRVRIYNSSGTLIQDVKFHTSCSQPLNTGNKFGAIRIDGIKGELGKSDKCPPSCEGVVVFDEPTATDECDNDVQVVTTPPSGSLLGPGTHVITSTATDACGNTDTCTFNVTVLAPLRVVFEPPIADDNEADDIETDQDKINSFKVGSKVEHKIKLIDCNGFDVTAIVAPSVTVRLDVSLREYVNATMSTEIIDLPENYDGVGSAGGTMVLTGNKFQYNLDTTGYPKGTDANPTFFRSHVTVEYNSAPGVVVGEEDALLESKK
jgi:hypothetical protein